MLPEETIQVLNTTLTREESYNMSRIGHYFLSLTALLVLLSSCTQQPMSPEPPVCMHTLHYQVSVDQSAPTKASLDGNNHYVFQEGDMLYVSAKGADADKLYGSLQLISRASDNRTAVFEGDLYCSNDFSPSTSTELLVTLVGADDEIHSTSGGRITSTTYSTSACADTFSEAVQKFSHFTASGHYGDRSFVLSQRSSFLCCSLKYSKTDTPENTELTIKILDSSNAELRTATVMAYETTYISKADFVAAFPENANLTGAYLTSKQGVSDPKVMPAIKDGESILLEANTYYNVNRSTLPVWGGFKIKASTDDTDMTFTFTDGIQFSTDFGANWTNYDGRTFNLNAGDEVCFKGTRTAYDCIGATQLFTADKVCYIAGDITSLLADRTQYAANAFRSAFSNGTCVDDITTPAAVDWVDIDSDDPLILPPYTSNQCYREMFRNCTSLTHVPDLPAETTSDGCYWNMFRDCTGLTSANNMIFAAMTMTPDCCRELFRKCTNLKSVPIFRATTLAARCYQQMLSDDNQLTSITCLATIFATDCLKNWVSGITNNRGTFYKDSNISWGKNNNACPSNWTIADYVP